MGLPSRSFAADAHDCIMVRIRMESTEYSVWRDHRAHGELPSEHHPDTYQPDQKSEWLPERPASLSIVPPRAQASRRCETQAALGRQSRPSSLAFRSLDAFRALREPDRRRRDEERPFPLRTKNWPQA